MEELSFFWFFNEDGSWRFYLNSILVGEFFTMMLFMYIAHDAKQKWDDLDDKPYQKRLEAVKRQEWYDHKRKLQEYEDYLYLKNSQKENETNN